MAQPAKEKYRIGINAFGKLLTQEPSVKWMKWKQHLDDLREKPTENKGHKGHN